MPPNTQTDNFWNTQGRTYQINYKPIAPNSFYTTADLWIPLLWSTTTTADASLNRRAELWNYLTDPGTPATQAFPILGFVRVPSTIAHDCEWLFVLFSSLCVCQTVCH